MFSLDAQSFDFEGNKNKMPSYLLYLFQIIIIKTGYSGHHHIPTPSCIQLNVEHIKTLFCICPIAVYKMANRLKFKYAPITIFNKPNA